MTRKDFELIAGVLKASKPAEGVVERWADVGWRDTVERFAAKLQSVNERFDVERFKLACGMTVG